MNSTEEIDWEGSESKGDIGASVLCDQESRLLLGSCVNSFLGS